MVVGEVPDEDDVRRLRTVSAYQGVFTGVYTEHRVIATTCTPSGGKRQGSLRLT
jgi:hypothetical protein